MRHFIKEVITVLLMQSVSYITRGKKLLEITNTGYYLHRNVTDIKMLSIKQTFSRLVYLNVLISLFSLLSFSVLGFFLLL